MNWTFLLKIVISLIVVYILYYYNITWLGMVILMIGIWSLNDDLKLMSTLHEEEKAENQRLKKIIEQLEYEKFGNQ